jgi:hypothetical protein
MNSQALAPHPDHSRHDLLLVAAQADGDLSAPERLRLQRQLQSCAACQDLGADLLVIRAATARLPVRRRPRTFQLSPADAARARSWWQRVMSAIGSGGSPLVPKLAMSLTTLGIAGLMLVAAPGLAPGLSESLSGGQRPGVEHNSGGQTKDLFGGGGSGSSPAPQFPTGGVVDPGDLDAGTPPGTVRSGGEVSVLRQGTPSILAVLSGSFLIVGLGLFAFRWSIGRFG